MLKLSGKIPIIIYPFFWLLAALIGWLNTMDFALTLVWIAIILISVVVHELGHALTARAFGQQAQIELVAFGGVTHRKGGRLRTWQEFLIVLNGPMAGFCLALASWVVFKAALKSTPESLLVYIAEVLFYVNTFWTLLNLLPVQPLDGGKLFTLLFEGIFGLRGRKVALFLCIVFAGIIVAGLFAIRQYLLGSFFFLFAFESYRAWKSAIQLTEEDENYILQHLFKEAELDAIKGNKDAAISKFEKVRQMAKKGVLYQSAVEYEAHLLSEKGEIGKAYDLLKGQRGKLSPEGMHLLHQIVFRKGLWQEAIELGDKTYRDYPASDTAVINAKCHAKLGQAKQAVGWLQCALKDGVPHFDQLVVQKEFDPIRNDPHFAAFVRNKPNA